MLDVLYSYVYIGVQVCMITGYRCNYLALHWMWSECKR